MRPDPRPAAGVCAATVLLAAGSALAQGPAPQPAPQPSAAYAELQAEREAMLRLALELAPVRGWQIQQFSGDERTRLVTMVGGLPRWYSTDNQAAADTVGADELNPGGSSGLNLTGAGVRLGIWDGGGVRLTHQEYTGRAIQIDSPSGLSSHASHVAGTMMAAGIDPDARGMSYEAIIDCYDFGGDTGEMAPAAAGGLRISNHSYGFISGWRAVTYDYGDGAGPISTWAWYGDAALSTTEDAGFGYYGGTSQLFDQIVFDNPRYLPVMSGGNDRDDAGPGPNGRHVFWDPNAGYTLTESFETRDPDGPWDCVSSSKTAKNTLVVGSVRDITGGYAGVGSVLDNAFSGAGPIDDGRIKPDIVANGNSLYSCSASGDTNYFNASGTSMSTPNASGTLGLLLQHWRATLSGDDPLASTMKALAIHAADEAGVGPGPDYIFGWGLLDAVGSAQVITDAASNPVVIQELTLVDGAPIEIDLIAIDPGQPIRATVVWTDVPGAPVAPALDDPTPMLVNDLDLRVEEIGGIAVFFPWSLDRLNPPAAATNAGPNSVDNVEVVDLQPAGGAFYRAVVSNNGALVGGSQTFSMIISNARVPTLDCPGDTDGDGDTDVFDFSNLAANFGAGPDATLEMGDVTGDGFVDVFDFADLAGDFGCEVD